MPLETPIVWTRLRTPRSVSRSPFPPFSPVTRSGSYPSLGFRSALSDTSDPWNVLCDIPRNVRDSSRAICLSFWAISFVDMMPAPVDPPYPEPFPNLEREDLRRPPGLPNSSPHRPTPHPPYSLYKGEDTPPSRDPFPFSPPLGPSGEFLEFLVAVSVGDPLPLCASERSGGRCLRRKNVRRLPDRRVPPGPRYPETTGDPCLRPLSPPILTDYLPLHSPLVPTHLVPTTPLLDSPY